MSAAHRETSSTPVRGDSYTIATRPSVLTPAPSVRRVLKPPSVTAVSIIRVGAVRERERERQRERDRERERFRKLTRGHHA